jgi:glycosyltransferase involved in cell wall biosynthesis
MTYNHKDYIENALLSCINQKTNFPFEIVVGDDNSTDGTSQIVEKYAALYPNLIVNLSRKDEAYRSKRAELGRLFNFTDIIANCRGKYIALLDGDDYWTDMSKLQKQVDILESDETIIASHHWQKILVEGEGIEKKSPTKGVGYNAKEITGIQELFANEVRLKTRTTCFRNIIDKNFFPNWFYKMPFGDVSLSFLLAGYGNFHFLNNDMAVYRITEVGASRGDKADLGDEWVKEHMFKYLTIWEQANLHYNNKYRTTARAASMGFYFNILRESRESKKKVFLEVLKHANNNSVLKFSDLLRLAKYKLTH